MKDQSIKKVVIIGSGPIIIGQAAEFDYAGMPRAEGRGRAGCAR